MQWKAEIKTYDFDIKFIGFGLVVYKFISQCEEIVIFYKIFIFGQLCSGSTSKRVPNDLKLDVYYFFGLTNSLVVFLEIFGKFEVTPIFKILSKTHLKKWG